MCTKKVEIPLKPNTDETKLWKMPYQISGIYLRGGQPFMMAKCGYCDECRYEKVRNWTYKIWLEALEHEKKCFLTLTYKDNIKGKNLDKNDLVKFIKRLRKKGYKFKYFAVGEYGTKKGRAHYHVILLGWSPPDIRKMHGAKSKKGKELFTSKIIKDTWDQGIITVQPFGIDEIGYITLYTNKNKLLSETINRNQIINKKELLNEMKVNMGLAVKTWSKKQQKYLYTPLHALNKLPKEIYNEYKAEYRKIMKQFKPIKQPEFNIYSKGMGYKAFINKQYYKYDLVINEKIYEIPKDFLNKAWEIEPDHIKDEIKKHYLERKKHAEENYIDTKDVSQMRALRLKEQGQMNDRINKEKGMTDTRLF